MRHSPRHAEPAPDSAHSIRRYSLNSLLQAACRVYQRGMEVCLESERARRRVGIDGLFDHSDTAAGPVTARWRRLSA